MKTKFNGKIINKVFAPGSKSEHNATYLEVNKDTSYVLRIKSGNPFDNSRFANYLEKEVEIDGELTDLYLFINSTSDIHVKKD
jgi:hypothetical protein